MASIRKRGNAWRARYRDDANREHARHFRTRADAQRWLDEVTAAQMTGAYVDPRAGRITLADYFETWSRSQIWAESTRRSKVSIMRSVTFADVPLAALRRSHLQAWVHKMVADGIAPTTIRTRVAAVRGVLHAAVADRVIATDPADGLRTPAVPRERAVLPTAAQVGDLLEHGGDWSAAIALAAFAGLRLGEIAGLQVGDVDFLRGVLHVRRQAQWAKGQRVAVINRPKYGSVRDVFVPSGLGELLAAHIAEHRPGDDPGRWLLVGGPLTPARMQKEWNRTAEAAKVPKRDGQWAFTLHDLRHFYASGLIAAGCDVVTVQRALGHEKATTTLNTYAHLWPTAEDRTRAAAAGMLAEVTSLATRGQSSG